MTGPLHGTVLLDEVQWLLEGGMHPALIVTAVGKSVYAIAVAAERAGRADIARPFRAEANLTRGQVTS